jgi:hypothetical protein
MGTNVPVGSDGVQTKKRVQLPTDQEMQLIKNFVILPLVLNVFERDKQRIEKEQLFKTFQPYVAMFDLVISRIMQDLTRVRKEMRKRGIKVYDSERKVDKLSHEYMCRGYMGNFEMLWSTIRSDVEIVMNHYLGVYESELVKAGHL